MADNESNKTAGSDKRKQSLYFPEAMLQEIKDEAARLDRSLSWVVQRAWKMARLERGSNAGSWISFRVASPSGKLSMGFVSLQATATTCRRISSS